MSGTVRQGRRDRCERPCVCAGVVSFVGLAIGLAATPLAQAPPPVKSLGNFSHIVASLDRSLAFYRDGLGLEVTGPAAVFRPDQVIMKLADVPGAQTRYTWLKIPGSPMAVELIEYKDIDRHPRVTAVPGSGRHHAVGARPRTGRDHREAEDVGGRVITVDRRARRDRRPLPHRLHAGPGWLRHRAEPGARRRRRRQPERRGMCSARASS